MRFQRLLLGAAIIVSSAASSAADVVIRGAAKDNTLYDVPGPVSNGAGEHFFSGQTSGGSLRRGLITFDIAGSDIPPGSVITSVTLTLHMSRTVAGPEPISLHRLLVDWGESTSDAPGAEGGGAPAAPGDATWLFNFWDTSMWVTPGGDFDPTVVATSTVGDIGFYSWSSDAMTADVQAWLNDPDSAYGWVLIGDEVNFSTSKRFDSRENGISSRRPMLTVEYTAGSPADLNGDGLVDILDLLLLLGQWGMCPPPPTECPADLNGDGMVDVLDMLELFADWS